MCKKILVYHDEIHLLRGLAWWNGVCDETLRDTRVSRVYPLRKVKELLVASPDIDAVILVAFLAASYPAIAYFVEWARSFYNRPIVLVSSFQGLHSWMLRMGCSHAVVPKEFPRILSLLIEKHIYKGQ